ncbi:hypothetical protein D9M71_414010 [compost metagenome]
MLLVLRVARALVDENLLDPALRPHRIWQFDSIGEAQGVQGVAVVDVGCRRPGTGRVHVPVFKLVVTVEGELLALGIQEDQTAREEHIPFDCCRQFAIRTGRKRPAIAALKV